MAQTILDLSDKFADNSRETWEALLPGAKDTPPDHQAIAAALAKISKTTLDGICVRPLYSREKNTSGFTPASARRGAAATPAPWDIRQIIRTTDPATGNQEILQELQRGSTSIHLVPAQNRATSGIALQTASDLEALLDGVYLDLIGIGIEPSGRVNNAIEWLFKLANKRAVESANLRVACNVDPFADPFAATVCANHDVADTQAMVNLARRCDSDYPAVTSVAVDTRQWHNLGANTVQELGIACATSIHHLKALLAGGLDLAAAQKQMVIHLAIDADFFTGIAKLRAMRELSAYICQRFSDNENSRAGVSPEVAKAYIHAHTSQRMLSRLDADNNQLRNTLACSAAAIGGADCISVEAHYSTQQQDYPLNQPAEFSRRVARNIQMVLLEESNLHRVADPLGGSPFIESLTSELVAGAWQVLQQIEHEGGISASIQSGSLIKKINETQQQRQKHLATRKSPMVGVSEFASLQQQPFDPGENKQDLKRTSEPFEALRLASWQHEKLHGQKPVVLLLNVGPGSDYRGRAGFSRNFLASAGISSVQSELEQAGKVDSAFTEKLKSELISAGTSVITLCSSDQCYAALDARFFTVLREAGATRVVLAGRSKTLTDKSLCDDEIYLGCNTLEKLTAIHKSLGVEDWSGTTSGSTS